MSTNTTGTSGTHDTNMFDLSNRPDEVASGKVKETGKVNMADTPVTENASKGFAANEEKKSYSERTGKPEGDKETVVIEVLTQESGAGPRTRLTDYPIYAEEAPTSGFRWWYVPVIAIPVITGTSLAALMVVRRQRSNALKAAEIAAATTATRNWLDTLRMRRALDQANGLLQQSLQWTRQTAQTAPGQVNALTQLVPGQVSIWRDQATRQADQWRKLALSNAQSYVDAARAQALTTRDNATEAVTGASQTISGTASHTLAFSLGALVAATLTYVLRWRQHMLDTESESTGAETNMMRGEPIL